MAEPGMVLRPVPTGERARRSFVILIGLKVAGSKYRPAPPRITVLPSSVADHANPTVDAMLAFRATGAVRPFGPRIAVRNLSLVRSVFRLCGSYDHASP